MSKLPPGNYRVRPVNLLVSASGAKLVFKVTGPRQVGYTFDIDVPSLDPVAALDAQELEARRRVLAYLYAAYGRAGQVGEDFMAYVEQSYGPTVWYHEYWDAPDGDINRGQIDIILDLWVDAGGGEDAS